MLKKAFVYLPTCLQYFVLFICMGVCLHGCLYTVKMSGTLRSQKGLGNLEEEVHKVVRHHMSAWKQTQISSRAAKCS